MQVDFETDIGGAEAVVLTPQAVALDRLAPIKQALAPFVGKLIYLTAPYTNSPYGPEMAAELATQIAAELMDEGINVFSPLTHGSALLAKMACAPTHAEWLAIDEPYRQAACACIVAQLPGWQESAGVEYERDWFGLHRKPVFLLTVEVAAKPPTANLA